MITPQRWYDWILCPTLRKGPSGAVSPDCPRRLRKREDHEAILPQLVERLVALPQRAGWLQYPDAGRLEACRTAVCRGAGAVRQSRACDDELRCPIDDRGRGHQL